MSTTKGDVFWSPVHAERLISFGNELRLFQVEPITTQSGMRTNHRSAGTMVSDNSFGQLLSINSDVKFMKCMSIYPKPIRPDADVLIAVGQTSGKVVLTSFTAPAPGSTGYDPSNLIGKEFTSKHGRQCNCICWNPIEYNLLAAGFEKHRTDHATLIWDINKAMDMQFRDALSSYPTATALNAGVRPVYELGLGESTYSLKWFPSQPKSVVCGMNSKHIKMYDLRSSPKACSQTPTKAVYGIALEPNAEHIIASFSENHIVIWDMRNFEKPLLMFQEPRPVVKIAWCSTRNQLLTSLTKDSHQIKLHDIQQTPSSGNYDCEPHVLDRFVNPHGQNILSSFAWHPTHEMRLAAISILGSLRDYNVCDRITLNFSPTSEIMWTKGKKVLQCIDARDDFYKSLDDISVIMRKRALTGYGLNISNIPKELPRQLKRLWRWVQLVKSLQESGKLKHGLDCTRKDTLIGVKNIICGHSSNGEHQPLPTSLRSEKHYVPWIGFEQLSVNTVFPLQVPIYTSEERSKSLLLCEWGGESDNNGILKLIDKLELIGDFTRAAALGVFNLRIRRAIKSLTEGSKVPVERGGDPYLSTVAMALSGYTDKNSLWKEMCKTLRVQMKDPYLKSIFTFLTCDNENYDDIIYDSKLRTSDRIGFVCTFLSDLKLVDYLTSLTQKTVEEGDLDGLLLTGVSNGSSEGLDLLERYIEMTSDVQTVSLLILQSLPSPIYKEMRPKSWVESYKGILDCWRLWHQRASFDIEWYKRLTNEAPAQQLYINCNFCQKSISSYLRLGGNAANTLSSKLGSDIQQQQPQYQGRASLSAATNKTRIQSCPNCRKPLPRCALCLAHLGTPGIYWRSRQTNDGVEEEPVQKLSPFSNWFTWCQSCRHGGHSQHIIAWFKEHIECPVSGCNCKCMTLDSVSKLSCSWDEKDNNKVIP